jgi:hypothetical protein
MTKGRKKYATKLKPTTQDALAPKPIKEKQFNIGKLIFNYHIASRLHSIFLSKGSNLHYHFGGIVAAYDEWFAELHIDQDEFDMVTARLEKNKINDEVKRLEPLFEKQLKEIEDGEAYILPENNPLAVKAAMDDFKKILKKV